MSEKTEFIDTHGHLNFAAFNETWKAVTERARERRVAAVVMPGSQYATSARAVELAQARPGFLFAAVGLHPTHVRPAAEQSDQKIAISDQGEQSFEDFDCDKYLEIARQPEVVAIGEVGLDTYRVSDQKIAISDQGDEARLKIEKSLSAQEDVLKQFIGIAQEAKKPLILHCRGQRKPGTSDQKIAISDQVNPHERLIEILRAIPEISRPRFVVHCYQGTAEQAERYLALGGLISFTGTITYSDDAAITEVVKSVPLPRLMIETDSPYLSPVPYRGEPNEPWKVIEVARRVSELQGVSITDVARQTTNNAQKFFGLIWIVNNSRQGNKGLLF